MRLIIFSFLAFFFLSNCGSTKEITDGSVAYDLKKYALAQQLLPAEINKENNTEVKLQKTLELANSYLEANQPAKAEEWLRAAIQTQESPELYFKLAQVLKQKENYDEAIVNFENYKLLTNDIFQANPEIKICEQALDFDKNLTNIFIENLEELNTAQSDYFNSFYQENNAIITSSNSKALGDNIHPWTGDKTSDLFIATPTNETYNSSTSFSDILNTEASEGSITFNKDYTEAYFTRCDYSEELNGYCKIYQTNFDGTNWEEPVIVPIFDDSINVGQPFLAADGNRLYFASNASFGFGGNDIYFMDKRDGEWQQPVNAGFYVNTEKNELFPTLDSKGNLYFSSDGRTSFGGLDIYKVSPKRNVFENLEHLPYPINSGGDDFGLIWQQENSGTVKKGVIEKAIFNSSRPNGNGLDDIYMYTKRLINFYTLDVKAIEIEYDNLQSNDRKAIGFIPLNEAKIELTNLSNNTTKKIITIEDGKAYFDLDKNTDYKIFVSKVDYFNKSTTISTKGLQSADSLIIKLYAEVELERIFPEKEIVIPNIYYDYDKATLRPESLPVLDTLVSFFEENNDLTIEIGSHTDSRGSDKYNETLSQKRAQSVVDYLISKGVPTSQLTAKGYGESKLTNRCKNGVNCSEEEHQENRRTTFRVITSEGVLESK